MAASSLVNFVAKCAYWQRGWGVLKAESSDYNKVKAAILIYYELVPEVYILKWRKYKICDNLMFVEAREKEDSFDKKQWKFQ